MLARFSRLSPRWLTVATLTFLVLGAISALALVPWPSSKETPKDGASYDWQQALQAMEVADFPLARTHLTRCLEAWPINGEAHFLMARACRRADDTGGWQTYLRKAEILQWPKEDVDFERLLMQAQSGDVWNVEETLHGYLDSRPGDEVLIFEALVKGDLENNRLDDVLELTTHWIERFPDDWQPRLFRGRALQQARSLERAVAEYRRLLELKPDHAEAHLELAGALMINFQFQEALGHFQTYLQSDASDPVALLGVANCQLSLGQTEAARAALDKLFAKHKEHAAGAFVRAKLELAQNRPAEALRWLKQAEALAPHETDVTYNLILVLRQLGKQEEALRYERKLQDLRQQFDRLENVKKQIRKEPDSVPLRHEAGALSLRLGRDQEAGHWLRSAVRLDPNYQATHKLLAEYFLKAGDPRRSEYHRRKAESK